ncbi:hypothetical protein ABZV77_00265 [Streptomyces sp. NPDC004732]|uniref:hypothetical protein n=1 Tax=Streptomyces sp. NPDC004732 TaxID=3154290 RepID=UPI0033B508D0
MFDALAPLGLIPVIITHKAPARTRSFPPPAAHVPAGPRPHYHLEHWTTAPRTPHPPSPPPRPHPEPGDSPDGPATYNGEDYSLTVYPYDPESLTGGVPRSAHADRAERRAEDDRARASHAQQIRDHVPPATSVRAAVIEPWHAACSACAPCCPPPTRPAR